MPTFGFSRHDSDLSGDHFVESIQDRAETFQEGGATSQQALLCALIIETVSAYHRRSLAQQLKRHVIWFLAGPLAAVAAYGLMAVVRWIIDLTQLPQGNGILVGIAIVIAISAMATRIGTGSIHIDLVGQPKITRFRLGRCEAATDVRRLAWCLLMFATLFGLQTALLQFTDIGFESRYGLVDSILLTIDNLLHGILFDFCELYNINFGPAWEHNVSTATLFLVFRIAFDVLIGVALYLWYRNHEVQQFLEDCPTEAANPSQIAVWIDDLMRDQAHWTRHFGAECVFLQMVRLMLENRPEHVAELNTVLPAVQISPAVRNLFGAPDGGMILAQSDQ